MQEDFDYFWFGSVEFSWNRLW